MCGIAAIAASNIYNRPEQLSEILSHIAHRGEATHQNESLDVASCCTSIGTNRLAIVSASSSKQPVVSSSGRFVVAFNGEVFNYPELLSELEAHDVKVVSKMLSDTTVLAAGIEKWGIPTTCDKMCWEGVFICLDTYTGQLTAARDHLGIKPLYYTFEEGHHLLLASEIKALTGIGSADIIPIMPGTIVSWDLDADIFPTVKPWWSIRDYVQDGVDSCDSETLANKVIDLLRIAVHSRVPEGSYAVALSGGIDSSIILRLAHEKNPDVTAFTLHREGSPDLPYARRLCRDMQVPLVEVPAPTPDDLKAMLSKVIHTTETWEWHVLNHAAPMFALVESIRGENYRVVLSGEGADELFGGYGRISDQSTLASIKNEQVQRLSDIHRTNCQRLDRVGMWGTLEFRVPFLDRALTEFCLRLDPTWLVRHGQTKWLLRRASEHILGKDIAWRPKLSFAQGAGYQYLPDRNAGAFPLLFTNEQIPQEWEDLSRFPAELVFLTQFLRDGYGRAVHLKSRSI